MYRTDIIQRLMASYSLAFSETVRRSKIGATTTMKNISDVEIVGYEYVQLICLFNIY